MARFEFQSTLHRNSREMHAHIAEAYLSAGGLNDEETQQKFLNEMTDEQLADDAIGGWELHDHPDFDRNELIMAIADLRMELV